MFDKDELNYLFNCVESQRSPNTATAKVKAIVMTKIVEQLENIEQEAEKRKAEKAKK